MPIPLALLTPLISVLLGYIPDIGRLLAGETGEEVGKVIERAAGSLDPSHVAAALEDPSKASAIIAGIEEIRAKVEIARIEAAVKNVTHARDTTVALAQVKHPSAYLAPAACALIFGLFTFVVVAEVFGHAKEISEATRRLLDYLAIAAASYSIGSSAGSAAKDMFSRATASAAAGDAAQASNNAAEVYGPVAPPSTTRRSLFGRN